MSFVMNRFVFGLALAATAVFVPVPARAGIVLFDLQGTAGPGLLPGNEPSVLSGGTGGEIGAGISYDDVANLLDLTNVGWGSTKGFTDLSSPATASHIHGPTASNNGNGFTQTAGVLFNLTRSSNAVTGGNFTNSPILLSAAQEADLLNGKYYINVHTGNNPGGEIRGFLVPAPVPEPATLALLGIGTVGLLGYAWRRRASSSPFFCSSI